MTFCMPQSHFVTQCLPNQWLWFEIGFIPWRWQFALYNILYGNSLCYRTSHDARCFTCCTAYRSNNFIVGLTNVSPLLSRPTLRKYTLCGQYPGAVPAGATVSLYCPVNLPPFIYVIVQFPITDHMNFCELEVLVRGMPEIFRSLGIIHQHACYRIFSACLSVVNLCPLVSAAYTKETKTHCMFILKLNM